MLFDIPKIEPFQFKIKVLQHLIFSNYCDLLQKGCSNFGAHCMIRIFGKNPSGAHKLRIQNSPNYKGNAFENRTPTTMLAEDASYWQMVRELIGGAKGRMPTQPLPVKVSDVYAPGAGIHIQWFGHSSYLLTIDGFRILVDPVLSGNASPIPGSIKAFKGVDVFTPAQLGKIDLLLLTHDHYDHLDYKTVVAMNNQVAKVVCSLGVASHLYYWGYAQDKITELDWWESAQINGALRLTAAPARHFSGRSLNRAQTFWSSFVLQTPRGNFYLGGDSGYDDHFKEIGQKYSGFELAILECGQYNEKWPHIHMQPEQTVQAAVDLKAKVLMPVHWGKFALAYHPWKEPIQRAKKEAERLGMPLLVSHLNERVEVTTHHPLVEWWEIIQ